jgi:hypothetical protein
VFDTVLDQDEVLALYNLQRPLVDLGATDQPGIYILDGRFRIASAVTGNRIEITAEQIAGYDSAGTAQFYLRASDGKALAGGGIVLLDEDGITITGGTSDPNKIKFVDGGGDTVMYISGYELGTGSRTASITTLAPDAADDRTTIALSANGYAAGDLASLTVASGDSAEDSAITLSADVIQMAGTIKANTTSDDIIFKLGDASGSRVLEVQDSGGNDIFAVDSDGNIHFPGGSGAKIFFDMDNTSKWYLTRNANSLRWHNGTSEVTIS